jgi:hypothetical protein
MADVVLKKGSFEVTFDFEAITIRQFRTLFDATQSQDEDDRILGLACGMTVEEIQGLTHSDYKPDSCAV